MQLGYTRFEEYRMMKDLEGELRQLYDTAACTRGKSLNTEAEKVITDFDVAVAPTKATYLWTD